MELNQVIALTAVVFLTGCQASIESPPATPGPASSAVTATGPAPAVVPAEFQAGQALYGQYCQQCHGLDALGSDKGPPFIDPIYRSNHHADGSFMFASTMGVRAHHWQFGDMPPVQGIQTQEVDKIVAYVRYLQRQAGIE